jgi:putative flippase GtrA
MSTPPDPRRPLRFLLAGGLNTAVGIGFYPLLLLTVPLLHTHYLLALAISQTVCLIFAFTTYKLGVFRSRGNVWAEFLRFSTFHLSIYALNWLALPLLVEAGGVAPIIAQSGFTVLVIAASYFWHNRVTFRTGEGK